MQSARRALRETQTLGNVSCLQQQFDQDNRLCCALQPASPNIPFRIELCGGNQPSFVFSASGQGTKQPYARPWPSGRLCAPSNSSKAQLGRSDQVQPLAVWKKLDLKPIPRKYADDSLPSIPLCVTLVIPGVRRVTRMHGSRAA